MSRKNILVVDDVIANQEILELLAENLGHVCQTVSGGVEALELIDGGMMFDVIFIDITMPGMSGEELVCLLQNRDTGAKHVAITGDSHYRTPLFDHFLYKPFDIEKMKTLLESF